MAMCMMWCAIQNVFACSRVASHQHQCVVTWICNCVSLVCAHPSCALLFYIPFVNVCTISAKNEIRYTFRCMSICMYWEDANTYLISARLSSVLVNVLLESSWLGGQLMNWSLDVCLLDLSEFKLLCQEWDLEWEQDLLSPYPMIFLWRLYVFSHVISVQP